MMTNCDICGKIEEILTSVHTITITNVGDCVTAYKVQIQHYSAVVTATNHSLSEALALAAKKMENTYPTIKSRLLHKEAT